MTFGETLAALRKSKGLSQSQLADALNLTRQTISKWELDQSSPDITYILQLSNYFQVSTDYLIKGPDAVIHDEVHRKNLLSHKINVHKWLLVAGCFLIGISLIGIIIFLVLSELHPWHVTTSFRTYRGLLGFLLGTNTLWFCILLFLIFIGGCVTFIYGILKILGFYGVFENIKREKKKEGR